ncbi:hypothetical protein [Janthinobacterium sp. NKUCC08_JDC]|uniref:hypothetical protein n=1 Tax=Janthinobacterium sp. NKUCC08_JDC TaxID=2842122 RepID=UPI001C5AF798|nr:hypothetical protein [Janthinobacterium sp. NKUCC08_JDC]MBW3496983.1 hypothetical protein [Janthinobacterium sp. NKUCC08_JDC]
MTAIGGARDTLLQATAERFSTTADGKAILLAGSTPVFRVNSDGAGAPGSIAITAKPINVVGDIVFSVSAGTQLTVNGNVATVNFATMTTDTALVQATIREFGVDYVGNYMISKVFDGVTGETGLSGLNTGQAFVYKRAAAAPADSPGDVIFTFSTASITTPAGNDLANGWSKNIPAGTAPLYVRVAAASSRNATDNIAANEWSAAVQLAKDGTAGVDGLNVAPVRIYQRGATNIAPALPSAASTFTFATGALTGLNNGWSTQVPTAGGAYLFTSGATAAARTATDDIQPGEWAAASRLAADGATGQRGTVTVAAPGYSTWSDASAVYELGHAGYGAPINRDVVTLYDATHAVTKYFDNGAWLVLGTVLNGNLLVNGSVATQALAADSVTADKIDARGLSIKDPIGNIILSAGTPLTANYMNAGIGAGNLISNSGPYPGAVGGFGLEYSYSPGTTTFAASFAPYLPSGVAGGVYVRCTGTVPVGAVAIIAPRFSGAFRKFPVIPGLRYELSAYMSSHRCKGVVNVAFFAANGTYISEIPGSVVDNLPTTGDLSAWSRSTLFATAPAGAAYASVRSVLVGKGEIDAYLFTSLWYFGVALGGQTVASAWADGPGAGFGDNLYGQITPTNSPTYIANAAIVNAQIGGDIYSSNWNGSTAGWLLDRNGNFYANSGTFRGTLSGGAIVGSTITGTTVTGGTISGTTVSGSTINGATITGGIIQTSATGAGVQINRSGNQNMEFFADVGLGGITKLVQIGFAGALTTAASFGTSNSAYSGGGLDAYSGSGIAISGISVSSVGILGAGGSYDFYASGSGANYGPFTGSHDGLVELNFEPLQGDILIDLAIAHHGGISNTIAINALASMPQQKNVIGVFVGQRPLDPQDPPAALKGIIGLAFMAEKYKLITLNSVGEGQINVCGEGGDIKAGDYITTSSMPGKGMRQADDVLHSYTVAKARESISFNTPSETRLIACTYHCG